MSIMVLAAAFALLLAGSVVIGFALSVVNDWYITRFVEKRRDWSIRDAFR